MTWHCDVDTKLAGCPHHDSSARIGHIEKLLLLSEGLRHNGLVLVRVSHEGAGDLLVAHAGHVC